MPLELYNKKRNFSKTPEPKGKISHKHKQLFVIQKHAASHLHYDFRLELNGVLLSWAVPKGPCLDPTVKRLAMHVEDHPVEYGHFEGIIPKGEYGGGTVMLWDEGKWIPEDENPTKAYHQGHLHFSLEGKKLKGRFNLFRLKKDDNEKSWFLVKAKDEFSKPLSKFDITQEEPNSVLTNQSIEEIAENYNKVWTKEGLKKKRVSKKKLIKNKPSHENITITLPSSKMPHVIYPQLATLVDKPPNGNEWLHELKFDGYRIITFKNNAEVKLMSRNNRDWTGNFENIVAEIKKLSIKNVIFDGEVVMLDEKGQSNFQLLQNSIKNNRKIPFIYYIFDILYYDNYNLMSLALIERKSILNKIITSTTDPILRYSAHIIGSGQEVFEKACEMGLEGIISKSIDSSYEERRNKNWLKVKCVKRQEFVVGGYSNPKGSRGYFGSLFLGVFNDKKELVYCGNVGTGFNHASLEEMYKQLKKYKSSTNPFNTRPPGVTSAHWVEPKIVVEIEFTEWTSEGILRHPSFKGIRTDKPANKIIKEEAMAIKSITEKQKPTARSTKVKLDFNLSNPNKVLYPEDNITKADLAIYYDTVQKWILPYITNRPLTLVRCPEIYTECFYQKNMKESMPKSFYGIKVKSKNETNTFIYIKDREGLLSLVQLGVLEIHPWGSRVEDFEYPDMITFDIDPSPEIKWPKVVETAFILKERLAELKLKSFVKTTGGKGLHVVVPIKPEYDWETVKNFSHVFVQFIIRNYPGQYVSEMSKQKRKGKIFIDYLRNQRGATAIAAYSTRARAGAPISTPIDWNELSANPKDTSFNIFSLPKRLEQIKKDPWRDFFKIKQGLRLDKLKK